MILSKNYYGLFMTYYDFFHNLSSGSYNVIFSPNKINTALAVVNTPVGGEPKDFISVIYGFLIQSTAALAFSNAGNAFSNSILAVSANSSAAFDAVFVLSSSSLAIFYSTSATADSFPTLSIKMSVSFFFLSTSTIFIFNSPCNNYTFPYVSAKIYKPYSYLLIYLEIYSLFSPNNFL